EREQYEVVKSYVDFRNQATAIYSHLQDQTKVQDQARVQVTSPKSHMNLEKFRELQAQRDALALKLVESPEKYQSYFDHFKIKDEKLLGHAVFGELREKVYAYASESDISGRATKAQELQRIINTTKDIRILKE